MYVVLKLITIVTVLFRKETCLLYTYAVRFFIFLYLIRAVLCFMVLKIGYAVGNFFSNGKDGSHSTFHRPDFYKKVVRLEKINRSTLILKI